MEFDEKAAERVRRALARRRSINEKQMMGAICFLAHGTICCGGMGSALMVRVGRDAFDQALARPHVRPLEFAQRRARGFILVDSPGYSSDTALSRWLERGLGAAKTARAATAKRPAAKRWRPTRPVE